MGDSDDELTRKGAITGRRPAKSAFTRAGKALVHKVEGNRHPEEVRTAFVKLEESYHNLEARNEGLARLIESEEEF